MRVLLIRRCVCHCVHLIVNCGLYSKFHFTAFVCSDRAGPRSGGGYGVGSRDDQIEVRETVFIQGIPVTYVYLYLIN